MKILVAHPGTQHSFQLAKELEERGLLLRFYTCLAISDKSITGRLITKFLGGSSLRNRIIRSVPQKKIKCFLRLEWNTQKLLRKGADSESVLFERNRMFQELIPDHELMKADIVVGFDTSGWVLAERCKKLNKKFILDVSIAHSLAKQEVYKSIANRYPQWKSTIHYKSPEYIAYEQLEMETATCIMAASSFTKQTLIVNNIAQEKILINPYGVNSLDFKPIPKKRKQGDSIRFVFVGLVDARKGVPLLLESWNLLSLPGATLTLIGPVEEQVKHEILTQYPKVELVGKLSSAELRGVLPTYDVLVFPSFFEGFGLVVLEAMACGLAVITTTATCAVDLMEHFKDGIILEDYSVAGLAGSMRVLAEDQALLETISGNAIVKAEKFNWKAYGDRWESTLKKIHEKPGN
ncbi:glycosyltransferase family 4 protein [Sediminibacterium ginsengisoli]|uniref:Glycosyltransferase involved in cell wall bisynthesis n=1 Tax=Sediminibacterium ginsengisoli TaxID=413434 RepID=A0A1T4Q573_9BACT|nr:glycosyltransferase family 4 protein [Sediminibacterium ginsengisoli]SJZ98923.1 Glycosyltransferase involved in cell wall bisynthesis [Sediminibacterium ginsengisoli]